MALPPWLIGLRTMHIFTAILAGGALLPFIMSALSMLAQIFNLIWTNVVSSPHEKVCITFIYRVTKTPHTEDEIYKLFSSFCPVSGSIVTPTPSWNLWTGLNVKKAASLASDPYWAEQIPKNGSVYTCCWPCICDIQEFVKVDTLWIKTKDNGWKLFPVLVIGMYQKFYYPFS